MDTSSIRDESNPMISSGRLRGWSIALVAFSVLVPLIFFPITLEELFTWWACRHGTSELLRITTEDVHPPLYFLLVSVWTAIFGHGIQLTRLLSGLFSLLSALVAGYLYEAAVRQSANRRGYGPHVIWLLLAFNATAFCYAHWARMYALMGLLGICGAYAALRCYHSPNHQSGWLMLTIVTPCLICTHHFAAIYAAGLYVWLFGELVVRDGFVKQHAKWMALSGFVCAVVVTPTLIASVQQVFLVKASYWIPDAGISGPAIAILGYFVPIHFVLVDTYVSLMAVAAVLLSVLIPGKLTPLERLFVTQAGLVALVIYLAGALGDRPIFLPRYLQTLHPLACVFMVSRIGGFSSIHARRFLLTALAINTLLGFVGTIHHFAYSNWAKTTIDREQRIERGNYALQEFADHDAGIVCTDPIPYLSYQYYSDGFGRNVYYWNPLELEAAKREHRVFLSVIPPHAKLSDRQLEALDFDRLIVVGARGDLQIPGWQRANDRPDLDYPPLRLTAFDRRPPDL